MSSCRSKDSALDSKEDLEVKCPVCGGELERLQGVKWDFYRCNRECNWKNRKMFFSEDEVRNGVKVVEIPKKKRRVK